MKKILLKPVKWLVLFALVVLVFMVGESEELANKTQKLFDWCYE